MSNEKDSRTNRGLIGRMVHNRVTPNLIMIFLIAGGLMMSFTIKKEVFPEHETDWVTIRVAYPGSSPEEIEKGIVLAVESAVRGLEGVKEIKATASEGWGTVRAEILEDADRQKVYQDIKQAVDRLTTLPKDIERPEVTMEHRHEVLNIVLFGDASESALRELAEQVRVRLLQDEEVTQVELRGAREHQLHVEVPKERLRAHGLTLQEIAERIREASIELPGGKIETEGGEILLRVKERRDWAREFGRIPIITTADGSVLRLKDLGEVKEGFEETDRFATFNGKPSIGLEVYRVGNQTPVGVSEAVRDIMAAVEADLPPGVDWHILRDRSEIYRQRLGLLLKNAFLGLMLVLALLGLFLELRLAFWVTIGIPTSFLGAFLFLPGMDVSINIISMFAFIIALGIVVDDAIVAGENIYKRRSDGMSFVRAAVLGAREVTIPISFSILTNIVAFLPLYFVPGHLGRIWKVIPLVVVSVFIISWVESLIILPAHLAHSKKAADKSAFARFNRGFSRRLEGFVGNIYGPFLERSIRWRYFTVASFLAVLLGMGGYVFGGRIGIIPMPRVESDVAVVTATLPVGSPLKAAISTRDRLVNAMRELADENGGEQLLEGIFALIEENKVTLRAYLLEPGVRPLSTGEVTQLWRKRTGPIVGLESLKFESDRGGPGSGAALTVELRHWDIAMLDRASAALAAKLDEFPNVEDIDDGYAQGKEQLDFRIKEEGQSLGLSATDIGRQVRNAFYGAQALRQQRGRSEVRLLVRLPESERRSEHGVDSLMVTTPEGREVPLRQVAEVTRGRAYTSINRREAQRTVQVTADVEPIGETGQVKASLNQTILPELARDFPGLGYDYAGRQQHMRESLTGLYEGFAVALIVIYFLLAVPFRSYSQPIIVMIAIPFGIVGAVLGHVIMDYNLSLQSLMGMVALSGVVVNDSLILVDFANRRRKEGLTMARAIRAAGARRFRPILLTTLTTFGGLAPMIFETSRQARFMIPMALSLGYGILFATVITLLLVPCLYVIIEDIKGLSARFQRSTAPSTKPHRETNRAQIT